jgi:phosphatidate cytidylyltransferase
LFPLVSMLVVVKLGDTGAYTVGRLIGKRKLAPKLSPGKTIEGLAGGVAFAVAGLFAVKEAFGFHDRSVVGVRVHDDIGAYVFYGVAVCLAGVAGDLVESLLKRDFGRKDSSDWMPGFGGILDLVDSPLLAAPVAWFLWEAGGLVRIS